MSDLIMQIGGFLVALLAALSAVAWKGSIDRKKGADDEKIKQAEAITESVNEAAEVRDDLRSDADFRKRVQDRFTRR